MSEQGFVPEREPAVPPGLGVPAVELEAALRRSPRRCNQCGGKADGHAHAEPDE